MKKEINRKGENYSHNRVICGTPTEAHGAAEGVVG